MRCQTPDATAYGTGVVIIKFNIYINTHEAMCTSLEYRWIFDCGGYYWGFSDSLINGLPDPSSAGAIVALDNK